MAGRVAPYIDNTGLVFAYDLANIARSYLGEPTVNLAYAVNPYLNSNSNWWINGGNTVFSDNDTSIPKPVIPNVDTTNLRIFSSTVTQAIPNQQLGSSIIPVSPSTTYSFSIYFYFTGTTLQAQPYVRTAVNNDLLAYFAYNGNTNYLTWPRNQWILLKATVTTQANENGIYMSSYTGDTLGEKLAYFGYQVEQKSHCTPLVLGTRSATQGLKDLTGNSTIDLSNVSFDSNAQMTFDGTNDTAAVGSSTAFNITNAMSVFAWIKPDSVDYWKGIFGGSISGFVHFQLYYGGINIYVYGPNAAYGNPDSVSIGTNVWTNVGFTFGDNTLKVYLNGEQLPTTVTGNGSNISSNSDVRIGWSYTTDRLFQGTISKVSVYNRALTASEIQQNFNAVRGRYGI